MHRFHRVLLPTAADVDDHNSMPPKGYRYRSPQQKLATGAVLIFALVVVVLRLSRTSSSGSATFSTTTTTAAASLHLPTDRLPVEVWARGGVVAGVNDIRSELSEEEIKDLEQLCGRTIYHGLENVVVSHNLGYRTFFATGDLPLMWIRDSAFQIGVLLPKISKRPSLRFVIEGAIRMQAFYILQDPYANGYYPEWRHPADHNDNDRPLGRGGWVGVRNYELDSGAYFLNLLWNYANTPGLYRPEALIAEPIVFEAAHLMVKTWAVEQRHNASTSPYKFGELQGGGVGTPVGYTGMIWSGFRPSDDANTYGFSIPSNMYAAGALERALELNRAIWKSEAFSRDAGKLLRDVVEGIERWGVVSPPDDPSIKIYAYEVDGLGHTLSDFDDPNWPSLVSMPLLGYERYDTQIYAATRARLLSTKNQFWFEGEVFKGMGSPHTSQGMAWALGTLSEAFTAPTPADRAATLRLLLKLQCGDGLMHESINVNNLEQCTRRWFEWANALLTVAAEHLVGLDCDAEAERRHRDAVAQRERYPEEANNKYFHQSIESAVQWDVEYKPRVEAWQGIGHLI